MSRIARASSGSADLGLMSYNFSIVGCQKAGTSTLAWSIRQHRSVCSPPRKEAHFFDDENYDWSHVDYQRDYAVPRRKAHQTMVGDATPSYIMWPQALERMHRYNPDMRLIAIFRDPLERLFSHWLMLRKRSLEWSDWPQFITEFRPETLPTELPDGIRPSRYRHLAGVARGFYGAQLDHGFSVFPREQWLLLDFRSMLSDFDATLDRTIAHLGLPPMRRRPPLENRHAGAEQVVGTAPTASDLAGLAELYAADLDRYQEISGIDTSRWPTRRILDGALDPAEFAAHCGRRVAVPA